MKIHVLLGSVILLLVLLTGGVSAGNHWDVSMTGSHGDTILVQAVLSFEGAFPCSGVVGDCQNSGGTFLMVSPCPLSVTCPGSEFIWEFYDYAPSVTLALQSGVDYTFRGVAYGSASNWYYYPDPPYEACGTFCYEEVVFDPVVFSAPVGTEPQTWGEIKALFK